MSTLADAKATLLRALEQIESAEETLGGETEVCYLCVVYSTGKQEGDSFHEVGGWVNTGDPLWLHAELLRRASDSLGADARATEDEDE